MADFLVSCRNDVCLFDWFLYFYVMYRANVWLSLLGAIVYAFASYNFIIIEAGHVTKGYAMAYIVQ